MQGIPFLSPGMGATGLSVLPDLCVTSTRRQTPPEHVSNCCLLLPLLLSLPARCAGGGPRSVPPSLGSLGWACCPCCGLSSQAKALWTNSSLL